MRRFLALLLLVPLGGCLMNWYHPFFSEHTRKTKAAAAEAGDLNALYAMGDAYCCGPKGGYYDTEKAMGYFCRAAKGGHAGAQVALGKLYENSYRMIDNTIPTNHLKAYMWYRVAENSGSAEGGALRAALEQYMTPENLARANELVAHWRETRCVLLEDPKGPWNPEWVREQQEAAKPKPKDFSQPQPADTRPRRR